MLQVTIFISTFNGTGLHLSNAGMKNNQRELFLSEVNNRETIAAIEANNEMHCL